MNQAQPPARAFAALSGLLLVTGLALLGLMIARLPVIMALWHARDLADTAVVSRVATWPPVSEIEPGNGPQKGPELPQSMAPTVLPLGPTADKHSATLAALEAMSAEIDRHRAALAERERHLVLREAVMASVEARIGEQLSRLDERKAEFERLTGQLEAEEQAKIVQLVKVYEAMKAKNAAAIFDPMALDLLLPIVRGMRETKVAAIVAEMDPAKARALTAEMARRRGPPPSP